MAEDNNPYRTQGAPMTTNVSFGGNPGNAEPNGADMPAEGNAAEASSATAQLIGLGEGLHNNPGYKAEPVKDITTAEFVTDVVEASKTKPVLVDFWAPWCGPCKQLGPAIESAVQKAGGKVKLVKMNIDDHPEIAGQMGIQSIPAVVAFIDGQPKDAFMGAKPEGEITKFIEKLVGPSGPSQLDLALEQGEQMMADEKFDEAAQLYSAIIGQMPDNKDALAGLGMALIRLGRADEAAALIEDISDDQNHARLRALTAALELEQKAAELGVDADKIPQLEATLEKNPGDHQARFDLALLLNGAGRRAEAADHLLQIIAKDRKWHEDGARAQLLEFFEAWGPADPIVLSARRRLSSLLFS